MPGCRMSRVPSQITVRMLLAHRSGLFDYFRRQGLRQAGVRRPDHVWTTDEILSLVGPSLYTPGTGFNYSNTNYMLLGLILEQVTGQPLATLIHDRLLAPLGMDETVFQQAGQPVDLVGAKGFWKSGSGFREWSDDTNFRPTTSTATVAWAAGAMEGSVRDLLDWEMALYGGQVLTPDELAEMLGIYKDSGYGTGCPDPDDRRQAGLRPRRLAARLPGGHVPAAGSTTWTWSCMANVGFANLDKVANRLAKAALNPLPTPRPSGDAIGGASPSVAPSPSGVP